MSESNTMEGESLTRGWHPDPVVANRWRYWDGEAWTAHARLSDGGGISGGAQLSHRRARLLKFSRNPIVFYPIAWLNCSVPFTRGRFDRFSQPREMRELRNTPRTPPPASDPGAGVR